jgi:hypothetical protein
MPTQIMQAVPSSETAAANGLNSVMRTFGSSLASALVGLILAHQMTFARGIAIPTSADFSTVFLVAAAVTGIGVVLFICIPKTTPNALLLKNPLVLTIQPEDNK